MYKMELDSHEQFLDVIANIFEHQSRRRNVLPIDTLKGISDEKSSQVIYIPRLARLSVIAAHLDIFDNSRSVEDAGTAGRSSKVEASADGATDRNIGVGIVADHARFLEEVKRGLFFFTV